MCWLLSGRLATSEAARKRCDILFLAASGFFRQYRLSATGTYSSNAHLGGGDAAWLSKVDTGVETEDDSGTGAGEERRGSGRVIEQPFFP